MPAAKADGDKEKADKPVDGKSDPKNEKAQAKPADDKAAPSMDEA